MHSPGQEQAHLPSTDDRLPEDHYNEELEDSNTRLSLISTCFISLLSSHYSPNTTFKSSPSTIKLRPHHMPFSRRYTPDIGLFVALGVLVLVC